MKQQRNTKQRHMVLNAVRARCNHPSADQIYLDVRAIDDRISRGTVYRNLSVLVQQGEVFQVKLSNMDRYECQAAKHYHLSCTQCDAICDAQLPYHEEMDEQAAQRTGYTVVRHHAVFEGLCPDCREKDRQESE